MEDGHSLDPQTVSAHLAMRFNDMKKTNTPAVEKAGGDMSAAEDMNPSDGEKLLGSGEDGGPSLDDLRAQTQGGVCEAWPLAAPSEQNGWIGVKLYIDEVGALKKLPRNARAEALAEATGQIGVSIFGDAYVGRVKMTSKW